MRGLKLSTLVAGIALLVAPAVVSTIASAKSTWPAPPRLKKIPESAIAPVDGVPRDMDKVKFAVSDSYVYSDSKVSEVPLWYWDDMQLIYAGRISPGGTFEPEAIFNRGNRMYYGTSKLDSLNLEPWIEKQRTKFKNRVFTVYIDGGYLKRVD
jgi:hypothetical protein